MGSHDAAYFSQNTTFAFPLFLWLYACLYHSIFSKRRRERIEALSGLGSQLSYFLSPEVSISMPHGIVKRINQHINQNIDGVSRRNVS
jgi:hypothetical protein